MATQNEYGTAAAEISKALAGKLLPHHAAELAASAISPDVAALRGYLSIKTYKDASVLGVAYGFAGYQKDRIPGLLIPQCDVFGSPKPPTAQYKPDSPRKDIRGRVVKYETPENGRLIIDCPPICQLDLMNPSKPLWIVEGSKKADAVASRWVTCISVAGVWAWRGRNENDGLTALPDWESIALNDGRKVYLCFDSDQITKPEVQVALRRLANWLKSRGAEVYIIHLPATLPGETA